ncbi:hypothetical protein K435DRAFT_800150 [Dendrothele bispora CBS 962.96]|uniref:DUF659 domain-containing protein n=1 Tax=Dendrothele bispora (strain CBS 962.96) TaxID=1314807 RepID=A0A4S8LTK3_DENBC|nr:hypothetical protein K435DRAFT_800150 [Dendrothele bispora CBS 962.96]
MVQGLCQTLPRQGTVTRELEERIRNEDEAKKYQERQKAFKEDEAKVEAKRQREQGTSSTAHAQGKTTALKRQISALVDTPGSLSEPSSSPASKKFRQTHLKTYNALQMPFSDSEVEALQTQALRAQVSSKSPETLFEDQEMLKFIGRRQFISCLPLKTDQWKNIQKDSIAAVCANVDFKSYTVELLEVTALNKDGAAQCAEFERMIDDLEAKYGCMVLYFVTDADGGSKKGHIELGKKRPYLILPSCWAHQFQLQLRDYFKVYTFGALVAEDATFLIGWLNNHGKARKMFDSAQKEVSEARSGQAVILAYVVANLTHWVLKSRPAIRAAQVGAAKSTEKKKLEDEANRACDLIADSRDQPYSFWQGLEAVIGDLEPICLATNITQKDSVCPDQVLLNIAGIYLHFTDHPEPELSVEMVKRIEKRWKDCDQPVFLSALILNPYEKLSCFGPRAGLNQFKVANIIVWLYRRMNLHPNNVDSPEIRKEKEKEVTNAVYLYLSTSGPFKDFVSERQNFEATMGKDPIAVWNALAASPEVKELALFAVNLFKIVVNSAGCERVFSDTKYRQSSRRNRLGLAKLKKLHKVGSDIRMENQKAGLVKTRHTHNIHKNQQFEKLLGVPRYQELLEDMNHEDESERGRILVTTPEGWQTEMAKWIGEARQAEEDEQNDQFVAKDNEDYRNLPQIHQIFDSLPRVTKPASLTLETLFSGLPKRNQVSRARIDEEAALMEALVDAEEDARPDDGAVEIDSEEEYIG